MSFNVIRYNIEGTSFTKLQEVVRTLFLVYWVLVGCPNRGRTGRSEWGRISGRTRDWTRVAGRKLRSIHVVGGWSP